MGENQSKVEFHVHTRFSQDSFLPLCCLLIKCKLFGIKKIAITDHNCILGAVIAKKMFAKYNVNVIVGEEIFTDKGEIIGLFLNTKIDKGMSVKKTIEEIKKQSGFIIIPHPYDEKRYKTVLQEKDFVDYIDDIDAIEFHNGRNNKEFYSQKQLEISKRYNKNYIIGSDAHTIFEIGRNYCTIDNFDNAKQLRENLNTAKCTTSKCIVWIHFYTKIIRVIKKVLKWK